MSLPRLGLDAATQERLAKSLDLIVNSAGLTDFNPDLRDAVSSNIDSTIHLLEFLRKCDRAGLMHLSTCYAVGMRDGRVTEELRDNYNPADSPQFDAEREVDSLRETIRRIEARAESPELTKALRRQALGRGGDEATRLQRVWASRFLRAGAAIFPSPSCALRLWKARNARRSRAGTRASTPRGRFRTFWARIFASFLPMSGSAST